MDDYFEEEEFTSQFDGRTVRRILSLTKPHWRWVLGFLVAITLVSMLDSLFTYLSKQIIDLAIVPGDTQALLRLVTIYGSLLIVQALFVFSFIYLAGVLGERIRFDLRRD
ncbi:MAG: ABC transporter transmembrane domain-containing protein, partial [Anaerolineales bacterium]